MLAIPISGSHGSASRISLSLYGLPILAKTAIRPPLRSFRRWSTPICRPRKRTSGVMPVPDVEPLPPIPDPGDQHPFDTEFIPRDPEHVFMADLPELE